MERTIENYGLMSTFELIDRINCAVTWDDEEIELCMRELCDRYNIDFDAFFNHEGMFDRTYEDLWDKIIKAVYDDVVVHHQYAINDRVYDDVVVHHQYAINDRNYTIVSLDSDDYSGYAVVDDIYERIMFDVYEIGTMQECKKYVKERIDID